MYPVKGFAERFEALLDELDALSEKVESEELEDLNAELEDALLLLTELDQRDDDWREKFVDAMDEFRSLAEDYRALSRRIPALEPMALRMKATADMALENLEESR